MIGQNRRSVFAGIGMITIAVIVTAGLLATFLNQRCQSNFRATLSIYPDAEIVTEAYPFLALQRVILHSADSVEMVSAWYRSERAAAMREAVTGGTVSSLPPENWVIEAAQDREGSVITISETCP